MTTTTKNVWGGTDKALPNGNTVRTANEDDVLKVFVFAPKYVLLWSMTFDNAPSFVFENAVQMATKWAETN